MDSVTVVVAASVDDDWCIDARWSVTQRCRFHWRSRRLKTSRRRRGNRCRRCSSCAGMSASDTTETSLFDVVECIILLECCSLKHVREKYFTCSSLKELFENVDATTIMDFIKEVNFYLV